MTDNRQQEVDEKRNALMVAMGMLLMRKLPGLKPSNVDHVYSASLDKGGILNVTVLEPDKISVIAEFPDIALALDLVEILKPLTKVVDEG